MRVLVTGAGGLLGGRLAHLLHAPGVEVTAVWRVTPPPPDLPEERVDLSDAGAIEGLVERLRPDAVLHAAALGRADRCEESPAQAEVVNARLPERIAAVCRARGLRLIALSTDLVLDGTQPFSGPDTPAGPLGVYGRTKLAGEEAVLATDPRAAVARVALVVGRGHGARGTASESVAWALAAGRSIRLFADEYRSPVDPESVAAAVGALLEGEGAGRYHLGGTERLSRHELALRVARALDLPPGLIEPARQSEYAGPDPRPADTSLDSTRAIRELGFRPRPLDVALGESRRAVRSA